MASDTHITEDDKRLFELGSWVYPQPVAMSCGRIVRSRSPESLVDAILKAAEILARYLATIGLGVEQAASATGLPLDSAQEALSTLVRQALVDEKKGRFFIKDHLRDLLREDADATADEKGE